MSSARWPAVRRPARGTSPTETAARRMRRTPWLGPGGLSLLAPAAAPVHVPVPALAWALSVLTHPRRDRRTPRATTTSRGAFSRGLRPSNPTTRSRCRSLSLAVPAGGPDTASRIAGSAHCLAVCGSGFLHTGHRPHRQRVTGTGDEG